MRTLFIALSGVLFLQITACKKNTLKTASGHELTMHVAGSGPKIQHGELVTLNLEVFLGDSLVQSTARDEGGPQELMIPAVEEMKGEKVPAFYEALLMMTKGDSAAVLQKLDSTQMGQIERRFGKKIENIRYVISVKDVLDKAGTEKKIQEKQAEMEAQQTKMQEQQAAVEKKMEAAKANKSTRQKQMPQIETLMKQTLADYKAGNLGGKLQKTASGLEYVLLAPGTGDLLTDDSVAPTHYMGCLKSNGQMFDTSFDEGMPVPFPVRRVVPGFTEGLKMLRPGGKAILFLPSKLGYGAQGTPDGSIPPNSDLVFYMEVE